MYDAAAGAMLNVRHFVSVLFTPIGRRMSGVHPNALTAASLVAGIGAGVAFAMTGRGRACYVIAGALVAVSGAADALDGIVARLRQRESAAGDFYDHLADRLTEIAILGGIALSPSAHLVLGFAVLTLTLLHSYLGTQIEATFHVREYGGAGKAEQVFGLIFYAVVMTFTPVSMVTFAGREMTLTDLGFVALGLLTLAAFVHRLAKAVTLARSQR
jgi:phosphatidylglycerophosphate synthase